MEFWGYLKKSSWEDWRNGLRWLLYGLMGIMFPLIIGFFLLKIVSKWTGFVDFLSHGELCIYAASLLAAILYSLDEIKTSAAIARLGAYALILIVSTLYASTVMRDIYSERVDINEAFLFWFSLFIFVLSLMLSYISKVIHTSKDRWISNQELEYQKKSREKSEEKLEESFDKTMGDTQ